MGGLLVGGRFEDEPPADISEFQPPFDPENPESHPNSLPRGLPFSPGCLPVPNASHPCPATSGVITDPFIAVFSPAIPTFCFPETSTCFTQLANVMKDVLNLMLAFSTSTTPVRGSLKYPTLKYLRTLLLLKLGRAAEL